MLEQDTSQWKEEAIKRQEFYFNHFSEDGKDTLESYAYEKKDLIHLKNKLGYVMFGDPNFSDANNKSNNVGEENSTKSSDFRISNEISDGNNSTNVQSNIDVLQNTGSMEAKNQSISENQVEDDTLNFIIKLLDTPATDSDVSLIEHDKHYYRKYVKLIFGHDSQDDLIKTFEDYLKEIELRQLLDSTNTGTGHADTSTPNPSLPSPDDEKEGYIFYYSDPKQIKQIEYILGKIESCSDPDYRDKGLLVSFIFVTAKIGDNIGDFPVIRVVQPNCDQSKDVSYFIDLTGRCYKGWDKFLEDNIFPDCIYCYPKNGFYACDEDGNVLVEFGESPESKGFRKISRKGDLASAIAGLGCAGVALGSLVCPIAAPILIGTSGVGIVSGLWSSGRSIYSLVDRKLHKQDLNDREAIGSWLGAATGVFSVASMGALNYTQYLARNGRVLGKAANLVVNGIEVTNTGLCGVSIGHQFYNMYQDRNFNALDSVNLALSVLFFFHSAMKFKTAKQIFIESQNDVINNIGNQLSRKQRKAFKKVVRGTTEANIIEGNARVIKTVINLDDPKSYFNVISKVGKVAIKTKSKVAFSEDASGKIKINGKIEVQPEVINSMANKSKQKIFNSSRKWHLSEKYHKLFNKDVRMVSKIENLIFNKKTYELLKKMSMKNQQDIKIIGDKSSNVKVIKNINHFFNIMKGDSNYEKINCQVKREAKESSLNFYSISQLLLKLFLKLDEAKETYDRSMKYYEENLKDFLEAFIDDVCEYLDKIFSETNENLTTVKHTFYTEVTDGNKFTPWNYFEIYFQKLWDFVPDPDSVVILPQKAGWLYLLANDSVVRAMFIAPLRINSNQEKVRVHTFIKNS